MPSSVHDSLGMMKQCGRRCAVLAGTAMAALDGARQRPSAVQDRLAEALAPLQAHLLPQLPAGTVCALRRSCKGLQLLVDTAEPSFWQQLGQPLLPHALHGAAADHESTIAVLVAQAGLSALMLQEPGLSRPRMVSDS